MEMRRLGQSGLHVSLVGLGCNNFGARLDIEGTRGVIHRALDRGITLFDTSDSYSDGVSESQIGHILGARRKDIVLASKFGSPMGPGVMQRGGRMPVGPIAPYTAEEGQQNADNSHNAVPRDARGRRIKKLSAAGETGAQQHHAVFYEGGCGLLILRCLPGQGPNTLLNLIQPHAIPDFAMFFTQQL